MDLAVVTRPPIELSFSRNKDLRCPYRGQRRYIVGADEPHSEDSAGGTLMHIHAAQYYRHLIDRNRETDYDWCDWNLQRLVDKCELSLEMRDQVKHVGGILKDNSRLDREVEDWIIEKRMAIRRPDWMQCACCTVCKGTGQISAKVRIDGKEYRAALLGPGTCPACGGGGYNEYVDKYAGTADRIEFSQGGTHAHITDYKFGRSRNANDPAEDVNTDRQLMGYAWLVFRHFPLVETIAATLWFVMYGPKNKLTAYWRREYVEDEAAKWAESYFNLVDVCDSYYHEDPWPAVGHYEVCRWCKLECPREQELMEMARMLL